MNPHTLYFVAGEFINICPGPGMTHLLQQPLDRSWGPIQGKSAFSLKLSPKYFCQIEYFQR